MAKLENLTSADGSIQGVSLQGGRIGELSDPVATQDAATKNYVDNSLKAGIITYVLTDPLVDEFAVDSQPVRYAFKADGTKVYTAHYGTGKVSVVQTGDGTVDDEISVGSEVLALIMNSAGTKLYVANGGDDTVSVIDTSNNTVTATIAVGGRPGGLALSLDGTKLYVANYNDSTVSVINTSTEAVTATITGFNTPEWMVVSADGTRLYVTDASANVVRIVNTATNLVVGGIVVTDPSTIVRNAAGTKLYAASHSQNRVSVIDINTSSSWLHTVQGSIVVDEGPYQMVVSPNGLYGFVVCGLSGTLAVLNLTTNQRVNSVGVASGDEYQGVGINPAGTFVFMAKDSGAVLAKLQVSSMIAPTSDTTLSPSYRYNVIIVDNGSTACQVNLPPPADCNDGKERIVKCLGTGDINVSGNGAQIDNATDMVALTAANQSVRFIADTDKWWKTS
jgi:YVTN family beta-propeller protein